MVLQAEGGEDEVGWVESTWVPGRQGLRERVQAMALRILARATRRVKIIYLNGVDVRKRRRGDPLLTGSLRC